jgi:hypothetical protein
MSYLVWRLYRTRFLVTAGLLVALAAVFLPTGVHLAGAYQSAIRSCTAVASGCGAPVSILRNFAFLFDLVGLSAAVPALFGVFWGAPLVAAEIEAGTHLLAWTQTVTRRRWLAVKLAAVLGLAALWGGAMTTLTTWWSGPANAVNQYRFDLGHFDTQGLVPVGYAVFGVALGVTAGVLLRRLLPALAVTLGGFAGIRFGIDYGLRPHYLAPLTRTLPLGSSAPVAPGSYWQVGSDVLDPAGHASSGLLLTPARMPAGCAHIPPVPGSAQALLRCLGAQGWRQVTTYQPAGRFWAFQGIETAIYLALAAVLVVVAFEVVRRRDA